MKRRIFTLLISMAIAFFCPHVAAPVLQASMEVEVPQF